MSKSFEQGYNQDSSSVQKYNLSSDQSGENVREVLPRVLGFEVTETGDFRCVRCGNETIPDKRVAITYHDPLFKDSHAGPGDVVWLQVPSCNNCCESEVDYGCLHSPTFDLIVPQGDEYAVEMYLHRKSQ